MKPRGVVIIALAGLLMGLGSPRDLSSPSARLVGHWRNSDGNQAFYGPANGNRQAGDFTLLNADGRLARNRYRVLTEIPAGEDLTIGLSKSGDQEDLLRQFLIVSKDGLRMTVETDNRLTKGYLEGWQYIDDKTGP